MARGARVIHVDPRFTRTSAVVDKHIPIRVGSDVVLLGALINYVLANDLWFKEYVIAYTNAATLVNEVSATPRTLAVFSPASTRRPGSMTRRPGLTRGARGRAAVGHPRARRDCLGPRGRRRARRRRSVPAARPGAARRDPAGPADGVPDSQAPLCPLHPRDGPRGLRHQPGRLRLPRPLDHGELRPRAHYLLRLRRRLDAAHPGRAVHQDRRDPAVAAGQRRPSRAAASWRCAGTPASRARPTSRRCSTSFPATWRCRSAGSARHACRLPGGSRVEEAEGILGPSRHLRRQPAQGVVGRRRPRRQRLGLRLPAPADRGPRYLPDRDRHARRQGGGLLPARPEPGRRVGERPAAATRHVPPEVAGSARPRPHRVGHVVEGRPGDRLRRVAHRRHRDRGVLPARGEPRREGRDVHPDAADAAVAPQGARPAR